MNYKSNGIESVNMKLAMNKLIVRWRYEHKLEYEVIIIMISMNCDYENILEYEFIVKRFFFIIYWDFKFKLV